MAAPNIVSVASILGTTQVGDLSTTLTTTLVTAASDKVLKINIIRVTNVTDNDATATIDVEVSGTHKKDCKTRLLYLQILVLTLSTKTHHFI